MLEATLEWSLRSFGCFWIVAGGYTFYKAREAALMDQVLGAITGTPEDPLVTRFLFVSAPLTLLSGMGLVLATAWAALPLGLLVASQLLYFGLLRRKRARARSDEERDEAQPQPATRHAFVLSLLLLLATVVAVQFGLFQ